VEFTADDFQLFHRLYSALLFYTNQRLRVLPDRSTSPEEFQALEPKKKIQIRDALHTHRDLIGQFVANNPFDLNSTELAVVYGWKDAVFGNLYVFRYAKPHTIFLDCQNSTLAYGVVALGRPMEDLIGPRLPQMFQTALLPFQGKIICDGLLAGPGLELDRYFTRMLKEMYEDAKADFGIVTSLPFSWPTREPANRVDPEREPRGGSRKTRESVGKQKPVATSFSLQLTRVQRHAIADLLPDLAVRLLLNESNPRVVRFTREELIEIADQCARAADRETRGTARRTLSLVVEAARKIVTQLDQGKTPRVQFRKKTYQFKITLTGCEPPIWRRIQVQDCTLDKLHEHIQTAMGWTNSHLHQFEIEGVIHGDPELICEGFEDKPALVDSRRTKLSDVLPANGQRFRFHYEYDFGDSWEHEILYEGSPRWGPRCPCCLEGERACPPENVGGVAGYAELQAAIADPTHEAHQAVRQACPGFDPERFDADAATEAMRKGLPDWRKIRGM
jgi:hypothetical protein